VGGVLKISIVTRLNARSVDVIYFKDVNTKFVAQTSEFRWISLLDTKKGVVGGIPPARGPGFQLAMAPVLTLTLFAGWCDGWPSLSSGRANR